MPQLVLCYVALMFSLALHSHTDMPLLIARYQVENELVKKFQALWLVLPVTLHSSRRCLGALPWPVVSLGSCPAPAASYP